MLIPATYGQALEMGYEKADMRRMRGYVKRRDWNELEAPIHVAGGKRSGQLYYVGPCYDTSWYCYRYYLMKKE